MKFEKKSKQRMSILNSKKSIDEVQMNLFLHVIENEVRDPPHISV